MLIDELLIGIFLSILIGAFIGVQREMKLQKNQLFDFAGFRTFTFISVMGFLIGHISFNVLKNSYLIVASTFGFFILVSISYYVLSKKYKNYVSETSQIIALLTFLIGILISLKEYYISIVLAILITSLLVLGNKLHEFAKKISPKEVYATMKFAIISFIILPILPNKNYGFLDSETLSSFLLNYFSKTTLEQFTIFNPYQIWFLIVFISGITYVGYILMKLFGTKRGILLTGILGGLMSSTATTSSFSIESKKLKSLANPLAIGIILASSIMFFRVILEVAVVNPNLVSSVICISTMGLTGTIIGIYLYTKNSEKKSGKLDATSPFTLGPAIKFGLLFVAIIFFTQLLTIIFGNKGIYFVALFSGFLDVDAITLTLAKLALEETITNTTASAGIFIAAISNTVFKGGIAYYLGSKQLSKIITISFLAIIIVGLITILL